MRAGTSAPGAEVQKTTGQPEGPPQGGGGGDHQDARQSFRDPVGGHSGAEDDVSQADHPAGAARDEGATVTRVAPEKSLRMSAAQRATMVPVSRWCTARTSGGDQPFTDPAGAGGAHQRGQVRRAEAEAEVRVTWKDRLLRVEVVDRGGQGDPLSRGHLMPHDDVDRRDELRTASADDRDTTPVAEAARRLRHPDGRACRPPGLPRSMPRLDMAGFSTPPTTPGYSALASWSSGATPTRTTGWAASSTPPSSGRRVDDSRGVATRACLGG
jgi:hypothetical protein